MMKLWTSAFLLACLVIVVGCDPKAETKPEDKKAAKGSKETVKKDDDDQHSGWWCEEHGVPEHECSMCSSKVAKECKAKGDWCDKHDRAKSQCFICDPSLMDKFAAKYEAKYGKKPPVPENNKPEEKKESDKKEKK
jgi:hypothetical protein